MSKKAVAYHLTQVIEGKSTFDGINSDGIFSDAGRSWLIQKLCDGFSGFRLLAGCHRIFEIISNAIDVQSS